MKKSPQGEKKSPPQQSGYPPQQAGYPPQQQAGYPPQAYGYPPQAYGYPPAQQAGYMPQPAGYPHPQQLGYPPQQQPGYPPQQQPGYPAQQQPGYPPQQQPGYPPQQQPGYPMQQGYPPQQQGYPPQQLGYPPGQHPGYAPQQPGYPAPQQQKGAYPPAAGYMQPSYPVAPGAPGQPGAYPAQPMAYPQMGAGQAPAMGMSPAGAPANKTNGKMPKNIYVGPATPSLKPDLSASASTDAQILSKAFKGLGCDEKMIRAVLTKRSCAQREAIKVEYNKMFSKELVTRTKSELTEPFERTMVSLLYTGAELDAYLLRKATKGVGTDESALRDILCTRSPAQIAKIKECYVKMHGKSLEQHIKSDTSGSFYQILSTLINDPRDQSNIIDETQAGKDSSAMLSRSQMRISAPSSLIPIFCKRNYHQLLRTFEAYTKVSGSTVYNYLKSYHSGDYEKTLMTIYHYSCQPIRYFSKQLREGILKRSIYQVVRVCCTRCEIDLGSILQDYEIVYKTPFEKDLLLGFTDQFASTIDAILMICGKR